MRPTNNGEQLKEKNRRGSMLVPYQHIDHHLQELIHHAGDGEGGGGEGPSRGEAGEADEQPKRARQCRQHKRHVDMAVQVLVGILPEAGRKELAVIAGDDDPERRCHHQIS